MCRASTAAYYSLSLTGVDDDEIPRRLEIDPRRVVLWGVGIGLHWWALVGIGGHWWALVGGIGGHW